MAHQQKEKQKQKLPSRLSLSRGKSCPTSLNNNNMNHTPGHYSSLSLGTAADLQHYTTSSILEASTLSLMDDAAININHYHAVAAAAAATSPIKPLTEDHLRQHTAKTALGHEGRQRRVKYYVESQIRLLRLQADLESRRIAEIQALVPLDTPGIEHQVIQDYSPVPSGPNDPLPDNEVDHKKGRQWVAWVLGRFHRKRTAQDNRRRRTSMPLSSATERIASSPSSTPQPLSAQGGNIRCRHSTYDHYRGEKSLLIKQGFHGLCNSNIASALGVLPTNPYSSCLASHLFAPPSESQLLTTSIASLSHQKRDSGVSVFASSSSSSKAPLPLPASSPKDAARPSVDCSGTGIIATRYPKMVSRRTLRDAAIRALSSDMSVFSSADGGSSTDRSDGIGNADAGSSDPCCCIHHHHLVQQQQQ